jgi:hypothetical protein
VARRLLLLDRMRPARLLLLVLFIGACGGDDDGGGGDNGGGPDAAGPDDPDAGNGDRACGPAAQHARFVVTSNAEYGGASGQYEDRPFPIVDQPEVESGGCGFFAPESYFCDPACFDNTICTAGETCKPLPAQIPVGTVHLAGTDPELDLEPTEYNSYYTTENYPSLYQPGALITLSASGEGDVPAFEIAARGVPELTVPFEQLQAIEHQDMTVPWNVADDTPEGTRVVLHMDSDHHGTRAWVECWSDDDGEIVVPSAVLDPLILAGETGIGTYIENVYMARIHRGTVDTETGCAALESESMLGGVPVETIRAE